MTETEDIRMLDSFKRIVCNAPFPVRVSVDPYGDERVKITCSEQFKDQLDELQTTVNNDTLTINYQSQNSSSSYSFSSTRASASGHNVSIVNGVVYQDGQRVPSGGNANVPVQAASGGNTPDFDVRVHAKALDSVELRGAGSVRLDDDANVKAGTFSVDLSGTGQVIIPHVDAGEVRASVSGTGQLTIGGTAQGLNAGLTGTGSLDATRLTAHSGNVSVSGTGQAKVNVSDTLSGSISGVGAIGYMGNPTLSVQKGFVGRLYHIP